MICGKFGPISDDWFKQKREIWKICQRLGKWHRLVHWREFYRNKRHQRCDSNKVKVRLRWLWAYQMVIREVLEEESWHPTVGKTCNPSVR
jgi:hypothetical protein